MKIQRKWSLIVGLLFLIVAIRGIVSGSVFADDSLVYNLGSLLGTVALPAFFLIFPFVGKKNK